MANARGGNYNGPGNQGGHVQAQFPAYAAAGGGQYYGMGQQQQQMGQQSQQQQQLINYQQYYRAMAPQQSLGYEASAQQQAYPLQPHQAAPRMGAPSQVPPPPPPPPGEIFSNKTVPAAKVPLSSSPVSLPPLLPPPLPPMFPWMSAALAESMTSSRFGKPFEEQVSNLPFVPIIVNDFDLAKMTENVIKEVESTTTQQLQYYKDVLSQDLPQALKDMFQPLYCKLCVLTLSSPVVAKDHYNGKRHKKAIETWFMKNPKITPKKSGGNPSVGGNTSINGYITKQQNQNPPNRNGAVAPPPPSLAQSAAQRPINNASQSQQQGLQPLIPGLIGRLQNNEMKRPAAPPPPPSITNAQQQKPSSITEKLLRLSSISSNAPNIAIAGKIDDGPKGGAGMTNTSNSTNNYQPQFKQQQQRQTPGLNWQKKSTTDNLNSSDFQQQPAKQQQQTPGLNWQKKPSSDNLNSSDFQQQQPAKKPRWETPSVPVASPKPQPLPSPQPQQKTTVGSDIATPAITATATATPAPPPTQQKSDTKAATLPPPPQRNNNDRPPPGAKGLCRICNVHLTSPIQAEQHFKGKNHAARVTALQEQGETDLPPPILPPPPQPKPQLPDADNISPAPGPMNSRYFGNQPQFNDMAGQPRGGRGDGGGGLRQPLPNNNNNNNRNNNFNNQRHNNNNNNNNRFNKNNRNSGPRF